MYEFSEFSKDNIMDEFGSYDEPLSKDFKVMLNGSEIPVYTCRISKYTFNRFWPGHQREIDQSEIASFVNIVADEKIKLDVTIQRSYKNIMIRPYSKNISFEDNNGQVSFSVDEGQYVFATDNLHSPLYIFVTRPIKCSNKDEVTYYFGPGKHFANKITLKDNESIYIDKDAHVYGYVFADGAQNIKIFGNGLLDDSTEERAVGQCYEKFSNGNIRMFNCKNVKFEGVLMKNSACWCMSMFNCFDVNADNIKIFGQWRYNTDGVDIVNSQNIVLKNSFVHSFDDSVAIKGIDAYISTDNKNILAENCVLWCDWGKACEIGLETACREYKNITFRNCDIIRGGNTFLDIQNGDCAEVHDILFENINAEFNSFDHFPQIQENDEMVYTSENEKFVPALISLVNNRFRAAYNVGDLPEIDLTGIQCATIHDIVFRNINVYYDEKIEKLGGKYNAAICVNSCLKDVRHYNIKISGLCINGEEITEDKAILHIENSENVQFTDEFSNLSQNTVSSENQVKQDEFVRFYNPNGKGKRVMFLGNSITFHGKKEDIGWFGNWGMAASCEQKDYVHLMMKKINESSPDSAFCICQAAEWERNFKNGESTFNLYEKAKAFEADIIIGRIVENCPVDNFDENLFAQKYRELLEFLNSSGKAKLIITSGFWRTPGDKALESLAKNLNAEFVSLSDLGENDDMMAKGRFTHAGVAMHPGDDGMAEIA